jgi:chromosome segregation ATPase
VAAADEPAPLRSVAEALAARSRQLEEAEARLETQRAEVLRCQKEFSDDRQRFEEEVRGQRVQLAADRDRLAAEMDQHRRAIAYRSEQLDRSRAALEQLRNELGQIHRETLEIRLATEELWGQVCGVAAPAAVTQSLSRIRAKLAEHYRMANADLQQHREEIERLRADLAQQHEQIVRRKQQVDQWATCCREEAQEQAARLAAQADDLARRETELRQQSHLWQVERLRLQQEIRRWQARAAARAELELPV